MKLTISVGWAVMLIAGISSSAIATETLPIKKGFYAPIDNACDVDGSYRLYNQMLTYWPDGFLNSSAESRKIEHVTKRGPSEYVVDLQILEGERAKGNLPPRRVQWVIEIDGGDRFTIKNDSLGEDWSGSYRYCYAELPQ